MSKLEFTKHHILIIQKLRRAQRATFDEIADYLDKESCLENIAVR